ncbi:MAG TPA: hypothetical protein VFW98_12860 [Gemmatimonadaceae bacterium]|nr:hypothetical protein [Gemmatimonadaceae bacterium]
MPDPSPQEPPIQSTYPIREVVGIADEPSAVQAVVTALTQRGIPNGSIEVICGARARRELDAYRAEHGLKSRLIRIAQALSDERSLAERYEQALRDDAFLVLAPAADSAESERVGEAMQRSGAHFVNYYGSSTITALAP